MGGIPGALHHSLIVEADKTQEHAWQSWGWLRAGTHRRGVSQDAVHVGEELGGRARHLQPTGQHKSGGAQTGAGVPTPLHPTGSAARPAESCSA